MIDLGKFLRAMLTVTALLAAAASHAQTYPEKPVTIVIPFAPGGGSDGVMRVVAAKMTESLKQQVLVDPRPGAAGRIAAEIVKSSRPDGYTLLLGSSGTHTINQSLYAKLPYDPVKDFEPLGLVFSFAHVLVVPADSPARSIEDLANIAKNKTGGVTFASASVGTGSHLLGEMMKTKPGGNFVHVAYKGSAPALQDLLTGRVDMMFDSVGTSLPYIKAGKLRALAVTSRQRSKLLPDVRTMAELGFANLEMEYWSGLFAPAGTPAPVVKKLNEAIIQAVADPQVLTTLTPLGWDMVSSTPSELAATIRSDSARLGKVVKDSGATVD